jgi:hypothetical protein
MKDLADMINVEKTLILLRTQLNLPSISEIQTGQRKGEEQ